MTDFTPSRDTTQVHLRQAPAKRPPPSFVRYDYYVPIIRIFLIDLFVRFVHCLCMAQRKPKKKVPALEATCPPTQKLQNTVKTSEQPISTVSLEFPPPDALLELARGEPNRKLLLDYREVIHTLRNEKGFSFREIAEWLTENGVPCEHNAVYRAYTKGMDPMQEAQVAQDADHEEREELS